MYKTQLDAQLILSIFRQHLHVSGVSRPIFRRYNRMYKTQHDAQLILSIFRQHLHVSGVSRPIFRRYNCMHTTVCTYYSFQMTVFGPGWIVPIQGSSDISAAPQCPFGLLRTGQLYYARLCLDGLSHVTQIYQTGIVCLVAELEQTMQNTKHKCYNNSTSAVYQPP